MASTEEKELVSELVARTQAGTLEWTTIKHDDDDEPHITYLVTCGLCTFYIFDDEMVLQATEEQLEEPGGDLVSVLRIHITDTSLVKTLADIFDDTIQVDPINDDKSFQWAMDCIREGKYDEAYQLYQFQGGDGMIRFDWCTTGVRQPELYRMF